MLKKKLNDIKRDIDNQQIKGRKPYLKPIEIVNPNKILQESSKKEILEKLSTIEQSPLFPKGLIDQFSRTSGLIFNHDNLKYVDSETIKEIENHFRNAKYMKKQRELAKVIEAENSPLIKHKIKLEEMITLSAIDTMNSTGKIRKMLHAPTLKVYIVRVVY